LSSQNLAPTYILKLNILNKKIKPVCHCGGGGGGGHSGFAPSRFEIP
jgi:hypothetical protein